MTETLKLCPFCGQDDATIGCNDQEESIWYVQCGCGAGICDQLSEEKAIASWNTRSSSKEIDRLRAALNSILALKSFGEDRDALGELIIDIRSFANAALSPGGDAPEGPRCDLCNDTGVWPTADGVGHRCSCEAGR